MIPRSGPPSRKQVRKPHEFEAWSKFVPMAAAMFALAFATYLMPILLSSMSSVIGNVAAVILAGGVTIGLLARHPVPYVIYSLFLVLGQTVFTGVVLGTVNVEPSFVVVEIKTVSFTVAFLMLAVRIVRYLLTKPTLLCAVAVYGASIGVSVRTLDASSLAYGRNFLVPMMIALIAVVLLQDLNPNSRRNLFEKILATFVSLLVIGNLLELVLGSGTWRTLVSAADQRSLGSLSTETSFFGLVLPRAGGMMVEPVTSGYIAGAALVGVILMAFKHDRTRRMWWVLPVLSGLGSVFVLVTAATKASLLMIVVAIGAQALSLILRGRHAWIVILGTWIGSLVAILSYMSLRNGVQAVLGVWDRPLSLIGGDSTPIHLAGLIFGLKSAITDFFGNGLGVGGNFSRFFDGIDKRPPYEVWLSSGSESAVGVLAYQTGLFGLLAFVGLLVAAGRVWGRKSTLILAVWSSTALMAESMFGPLVAALFMIGAAMLMESTAPSRLDNLLTRLLFKKRKLHNGI